MISFGLFDVQWQCCFDLTVSNNVLFIHTRFFMARFVLFGRKTDDDIHSSRCPPLVMIWLWRLTLRINDSFIVVIIRSSVAHSFAMTTYIYFSYFTKEKNTRICYCVSHVTDIFSHSFLIVCNSKATSILTDELIDPFEWKNILNEKEKHDIIFPTKCHKIRNSFKSRLMF